MCGHEVNFSPENFISMFFLPEVQNLSFPVILFDFKNLINSAFLDEFQNITSHNITDMANLLVCPDRMYGRAALQLSGSAPSIGLNHIVSAIVHHCFHTYSVTLF